MPPSSVAVRFALVMVAFALVLGSIVAAPSDAAAHGELVASSPAPGEIVGFVDEVDLVFSTPVFDWSVTVENPAGEPLGALAVEEAPFYLTIGPDAPLTDEGQYILRYSATDSDGDLVEGAYAFSVESGAPSPAELPVDLSFLEDESLPWWNYALLVVAVVVIAVLAGLLAEKVRRLRALEAAN